MRNIIKLLLPPIFIKLFRVFFIKKSNSISIQFDKTTLCWDEIQKKTSGYSAENILIKCRDALLKVKNGEYPYERDSVLFNKKEIFIPLLASLLFSSISNNKKLNLIDFGGSLGSTYFQNKDILKQSGVVIEWNIVEQENFVKCGKEYFENEELHFFSNIFDTNISCTNICLFSSVLQYLKNPYEILKYIVNADIKYIVIDRTIFLENEKNDILSIQTVPNTIYDASYPHWFLSLEKFLKYIRQYYDIILEWYALDQHHLQDYKTAGLGFFLMRKQNLYEDI